jgi:hypothetical protein
MKSTPTTTSGASVAAAAVLITLALGATASAHHTPEHARRKVTSKPIAVATSVGHDFPKKIDAKKRYVFYLHGRIIESQGLRPKNELGIYEYEAILGALEGGDRVVISEGRPNDTEHAAYADKVVKQIRQLLTGGVPAKHITVIGASKGAGIAMYVSSKLRDREVNYVLMAGCTERFMKTPELDLYGRVLSIYDYKDGVGSCSPLIGRSKGVAAFEELKLKVGTGHGILYQPIDAWVKPALTWSKR